jgi:hypothetical protein
MTKNEKLKAVRAAEQQIAKVLETLEIETACYVGGICIRTDEVTTISSPAPDYIRSVAI